MQGFSRLSKAEWEVGAGRSAPKCTSDQVHIPAAALEPSQHRGRFGGKGVEEMEGLLFLFGGWGEMGG